MRINQTDLYNAVERLESKLDLKLNTNIWHKHYSVHVLHGTSACGAQIAAGTTARECYDQVWAAIRALDINADHARFKEKQS